jgi:hypothetical protein
MGLVVLKARGFLLAMIQPAWANFDLWIESRNCGGSGLFWHNFCFGTNSISVFHQSLKNSHNKVQVSMNLQELK